MSIRAGGLPVPYFTSLVFSTLIVTPFSTEFPCELLIAHWELNQDLENKAALPAQRRM